MIGQHIHNYEINAHLGEGGMGKVFRATDSMLGREVALKMLHPQLTIEPQFLERFKKEARILAQLLHPNIAVIYNFIEQGGNQFMVMEYVEGTSLDDLLKKYQVLPAEFVVPVFIQALEGLQHAHKKNILHRDIKPANLMITNDGTLKIMDFGIAKVAGEQKMTQVNKIVGTVEFMAPELIEGKDASPQSDIYSMGATLYELVSGKIPFEGDTDFNLMQAILQSKVKRPEKLNPLVPGALGDIILKAMDKNPQQRFTSARAFQHALIAAFPQYPEIDINVLKRAQQTVYADKFPGQPPPPTQLFSVPASQATLEEASKSPAAFQQFKQRIISNKKLSLVILGMVFLVITIFSLTAKKGDQPAETLIAQKDSASQVVQNVSNVSSNSQVSLPDNLQSPTAPAIDKRIPVTDNAVEEIPLRDEKKITGIKNEIRIVKEKPKRIVKNEKKLPAQKSVEDIEKESPRETKPPEKKEIYINSEVTVPLSLIGMPDMNQKKKSAQRVSFSVTRPVYYNGVMIIRQGARAGGSLTIGSRRTDIEIYYVEGANGMRIPVRSESEHGRRKDIESNSTFNAVIQQGTKMSF